MQFEHVLTPQTPFNTQDFSKVLIPKVGMQLDILKNVSFQFPHTSHLMQGCVHFIWLVSCIDLFLVHCFLSCPNFGYKFEVKESQQSKEISFHNGTM
jgi:hypothetical protein